MTTNKSIRINGQVIHEPYKNVGLIKYLPQFNFVLQSISVKQLFKQFKIDFNDFRLRKGCLYGVADITESVVNNRNNNENATCTLASLFSVTKVPVT